MKEPHCRSAQVWHALSMDHTVLPAIHAFIYEWIEPYLPFAFTAEAGPHLLIAEGRKAESALAPPRWVNRTVTWRISQLLATQTVTPHRATDAGAKGRTLDLLGRQPEPPSHPSYTEFADFSQQWLRDYRQHSLCLPTCIWGKWDGVGGWMTANGHPSWY